MNIGEGPGLLEEMIDFEMELAVVVARNPGGEVKSYPVVGNGVSSDRESD